MATGDVPEEIAPTGWRRVPSRRSTPDLVVELQAQATTFTLAAIAVVNESTTHFVFAIDDDPLGALNALIRAGGHPIGIVGARIEHGAVEYRPQPFVEYQRNPSALAYLQSLRVPFLTLMRTHVDRMPDNPRNN